MKDLARRRVFCERSEGSGCRVYTGIHCPRTDNEHSELRRNASENGLVLHRSISKPD